jgi:adenylate cyclase
MANAATPVGYFLTYAAEAQLALGAVDEGLAVTAEGLGRCERELARVHEPELLRLEGELLRLRGDEDGALDRFERAVALATGREARTWRLRAAVSLARALADRGRRREAHDALRAALTDSADAVTSPDVRAALALADTYA